MLTSGVLLSMPLATAGAAVISPHGMGVAAQQQAVIDRVQYRWEGRQYCWYPDGWHGPGFYRCGYRLRVGQGWGGPAGWNGWRARERERFGVEERGTRGRRGTMGIEERGRSTTEGRARVGTEPSGRMGTEGTTGRSGTMKPTAPNAPAATGTPSSRAPTTSGTGSRAPH
jgi:hypothetical protein